MQGVPELISQPMLQWGFAGFCLILTGIIVWLIRRLLDVLDKTGEIISENTGAIREVHRTSQDLLRLEEECQRRLLQRPCMMKEND